MAAAGIAYKVVGIGAGVVATKVARSVLDKGWEKARGGEPPRNPAVPGVGWTEAISWAVASGVAVGMAKLLATKGAANAWVKATGSLPPGVEEVGN